MKLSGLDDLDKPLGELAPPEVAPSLESEEDESVELHVSTEELSPGKISEPTSEAVPFDAEPPKPKNWSGTADPLSSIAAVERARLLPGGHKPTAARPNYPAIQKPNANNQRVYDPRLYRSEDFYSNPKEWPKDLLLFVLKLYSSGHSLVRIINGVSKQRVRDAQGNIYPPFIGSRLGPLRLVDLYAVLCTCHWIHEHATTITDAELLPFALPNLRPAIIDREHPSNTELPLEVFPEMYRLWTERRRVSAKRVAQKLLLLYPSLDPLQISWTLYKQLARSLRRRYECIVRTQETTLVAERVAMELLEDLKKQGLVFSAGGELLALIPCTQSFPFSELQVPEYPLRDLFQAAPVWESLAKDRPLESRMQQLRELLKQYRTDNRLDKA